MLPCEIRIPVNASCATVGQSSLASPSILKKKKAARRRNSGSILDRNPGTACIDDLSSSARDHNTNGCHCGAGPCPHDVKFCTLITRTRMKEKSWEVICRSMKRLHMEQHSTAISVAPVFGCVRPAGAHAGCSGSLKTVQGGERVVKDAEGGGGLHRATARFVRRALFYHPSFLILCLLSVQRSAVKTHP